MTTLKAFREDGTEVLPGDTITQLGGTETFRAATVASNDRGTGGMIAVDGYPHLFSAPFRLTVRAVPGTSTPPQYASPVRPDVAVVNATNADLRAELAYRNVEASTPEQTARTTAPPVPGVTQNAGYTVYAVIRVNHVPGEPIDDEWIVAAADDKGEHVTWNARASDDGSGRLHYETGHYHSPGQGTRDEALVNLASRAGIFTMLTGLSSGAAARGAFQDSHQKVLDELAGIHGVGRARVRSGLLEAAALGYAMISWHDRSVRHDYGIRYDRVRCTFTWSRTR